MQEGPQIGWDPASIDYHLPWASRLLILYLLIVVTISIVKSASVLRMLWAFTRGSLRLPNNEEQFLLAWEKCSNKVHSIKRSVSVTVFWTVLVATMLVRNTLIILVEEKTFAPAAFIGTLAEVLSLFALSILVCAVLYTACAFYEGALLRRRESWNYAHASIENRQPKG